jgi:hypothetical protein
VRKYDYSEVSISKIEKLEMKIDEAKKVVDCAKELKEDILKRYL